MMNDDSERLFAYGCNEYNHIKCPASAIGKTPEPGTTEEHMAAEYDSVVQDNVVSNEGTIYEPIAKEFWLEAIEELRRAGSLNDRPSYDEIAADFGEEVAEELGWL